MKQEHKEKAKKLCPACKSCCAKSDFVCSYGNVNPRGKFCYRCYLVREGEEMQRILEQEKHYTSYVRRFHGNDWAAFALPHQLYATLYVERKFCIYCGSKLGPMEDRDSKGRVRKKHIHLDHMNPLEVGGEDSFRNCVICCAECNLRKGAKPFIQWLSEIPASMRTIARKIYISKMNEIPEKFRPGPATERVSFAGTHLIIPEDVQ
jgi:5-methylcytosine-specific restriction endonuclease McrA